MIKPRQDSSLERFFWSTLLKNFLVLPDQGLLDALEERTNFEETCFSSIQEELKRVSLRKLVTQSSIIDFAQIRKKEGSSRLEGKPHKVLKGEERLPNDAIDS